MVLKRIFPCPTMRFAGRSSAFLGLSMSVGLLMLSACGNATSVEVGRASFDGNASAEKEVPMKEDGETPVGKWRKYRGDAAADRDAQVIAELQAIGYADGTRDVQASSTVPVYDKERAYNGYNLFNSGHTAEAMLVDMEGNELHGWSLPFARAFPDEKQPMNRVAKGTNHWRRIHLREDGGLYAIFEGQGLISINKDSQLEWANLNGAHHDLFIMDDGNLAVLTRTAHIKRSYLRAKPIAEDFIDIVSAETGETIRRISLLDALVDSPFGKKYPKITGKKKRDGDIFHTNSLEIIDGSAAENNPAFVEGAALVSMRQLDAVMLVDLTTGLVTWEARGVFKRQHDPKLVGGGDLLVFDNGKGGRSSAVRRFRVSDMKETWSYVGNQDHEFWSATLGTAQELPNGNILMTESDGGRAVEVTPQGETVWEFYNPNRAGDDKEFIAAIFEMMRLEPSSVEGWLKAR